MKGRFPLWSAVLDGMGSPASLYADPPDYHAYGRQTLPASYGFAVAGAFLSDAMAGMNHAGQPTAGPKPGGDAKQG